MGLVKRITRSRPVQETLGFLVAGYLKLVQRTNRFVMEPADAYDRIEMPVIAAMWHGQHFMIHFAKRPQDRAASLVSRSGDGEFNAIALRHLGVRAIRGSGARGRDIRKKGGVQALRAMLQGAERRGDGGDDRRHSEDRAGLRPGHRHAGAIVRTADRAGRGGHEPPHRFRQLGQGQHRPPLRPRRDRARRSGSRAARGGRRGHGASAPEPSSGSSTGCTSAPMRLWDPRIPAPRIQAPRIPAPSLTRCS